MARLNDKNPNFRGAVPTSGVSSNYGPPWYDVKFKNSARNRRSLARKNTVYFSDWHSTGTFLRSSARMHGYLASRTRRVMRELRLAIPLGKDGSDGHFKHEFRMKSAPRGNIFSDRMGFQIYTMNKAFIPANEKSGSRAARTRWTDKALRRASKNRLYKR